VNSFQCKGLRKSMDTGFIKLKMQNNITTVLSSFRRRHRADIEHFAPTPEELSRLLEQREHRPAAVWRTLTFSTSGFRKGPRISWRTLAHPFPSTTATVTSLNRSLAKSRLPRARSGSRS